MFLLQYSSAIPARHLFDWVAVLHALHCICSTVFLSRTCEAFIRLGGFITVAYRTLSYVLFKGCDLVPAPFDAPHTAQRGHKYTAMQYQYSIVILETADLTQQKH